MADCGLAAFASEKVIAVIDSITARTTRMGYYLSKVFAYGI